MTIYKQGDILTVADIDAVRSLFRRILDLA